MATWGSQTWGFASWGTLGDQTVELSGVQSNSQQGSVDQGSNPGWGAQYWGAGEWGDLASPEVQVTGIQLNSNIEAVNTQADGLVVTANDNTKVIALNNVVAGTSVLQTVSGIQSTAEHGSVFAGELVTVQVTSASNEAWGENAWSDGGWGVGDGQTVSIGDTSVAIGQQIDAQGQELTVSLTDVLAGISIIAAPTGEELTPDLGSLSFESKYLIGSAQADTAVETALGLANANVDVTGVESTLSEGTVDPAPDAMVTGVGMTITSGVGTVTASASVNTTGSEATVETDSPILIGTANIDVTGVELTGSTGQLEFESKYLIGSAEATSIVGNAFGGELVEVQVTTASAQPWGEVAWGDGQWGQSVGTDIGIGGEEVAVPSVEVDVTGIELSSNTGNEAVTGDSNLSLTGIGLDLQLGDEDAFTNVRINVSGNDIGTIVIGDYLAGISAEAQPSGVTMTSSSGTIGLNAWELVDPGTAPTWTVVDKAA